MFNNIIKLVILDIDGVLTDGTKTYDIKGNVISKRFNDKDFTAIKRLKAAGINVCFLSGDNNINEKIANNRNIDFYHSRINNVLNKMDYLPILYKRYKANKTNTVYVGDDYFDLEIIDQLFYTFCPVDAIKNLRDRCHTILSKKGGEGVVSELYDFLETNEMISTGKYEHVKELDKNEK